VWVAFDLLRGGGILAKVYFMPILQWVDRGVPTKDVVFDAMRACGGRHGRYDEPIAMLDDYLRSHAATSDGTPPVVEMVAIDCLNSADARIKVYLRTNANTLERAKRLLTLGGRLTGDIVDAGLDALSELWPILFRLGPPSDANLEKGAHEMERVEIFPEGSYCGCAVEMRPGRSEPETKIHMPVRKIPGTDAQICQSLASWFAKRGHAEFGASYQANLEQVLCVVSPIPSLFILRACLWMLRRKLCTPVPTTTSKEQGGHTHSYHFPTPSELGCT
jgi:tryptophan 7-dimethylallyltransferase